jgi:anti-anti-sigma regulatory factor
MTATRFCDSIVFRMLLAVHDRLAAAGIQLTIVIPAGSPVLRALQLIGFDQILPIAIVPSATTQQFES